MLVAAQLPAAQLGVPRQQVLQHTVTMDTYQNVNLSDTNFFMHKNLYVDGNLLLLVLVNKLPWLICTC